MRYTWFDWLLIFATGQCVIALFRGDACWAIALAFFTSCALLPRSDDR